MYINDLVKQYRRIILHVRNWKIKLLKGSYPPETLSNDIERKIMPDDRDANINPTFASFSSPWSGSWVSNGSMMSYARSSLRNIVKVSTSTTTDFSGYNQNDATIIMYNNQEIHIFSGVVSFIEFLDKIELTIDFNFALDKWVLENI